MDAGNRPLRPSWVFPAGPEEGGRSSVSGPPLAVDCQHWAPTSASPTLAAAWFGALSCSAPSVGPLRARWFGQSVVCRGPVRPFLENRASVTQAGRSCKVASERQMSVLCSMRRQLRPCGFKPFERAPFGARQPAASGWRGSSSGGICGSWELSMSVFGSSRPRPLLRWPMAGSTWTTWEFAGPHRSGRQVRDLPRSSPVPTGRRGSGSCPLDERS